MSQRFGISIDNGGKTTGGKIGKRNFRAGTRFRNFWRACPAALLGGLLQNFAPPLHFGGKLCSMYAGDAPFTGKRDNAGYPELRYLAQHLFEGLPLEESHEKHHKEIFPAFGRTGTFLAEPGIFPGKKPKGDLPSRQKPFGEIPFTAAPDPYEMMRLLLGQHPNSFGSTQASVKPYSRERHEKTPLSQNGNTKKMKKRKAFQKLSQTGSAGERSSLRQKTSCLCTTRELARKKHAFQANSRHSSGATKATENPHAILVFPQEEKKISIAQKIHPQIPRSISLPGGKKYPNYILQKSGNTADNSGVAPPHPRRK